MKKFTLLLTFLILICSSSAALALDTSDSIYSGVIRITNNSTATSDVAVPFSANTSIYIDASYMNNSANNTAITSSSGASVNYMPGFNGTYPWVVHVPSIDANDIMSDTLFMGGATDMEGNLRYFPASGGMTTPDSASLELGDNFTTEQTGFVNTDNGSSKNLIYKEDAFRVFVSPTVSEAIIARIINSDVVTAAMLSQSGLGSWNAAQLIDSNVGTRGFSLDASGAGSYMRVDFGAGESYEIIKWRYYVDGADAKANWSIQYSDNATDWDDAYTGFDVHGASGWHECSWEGAGSHRYWQSYKTDGAGSTDDHMELECYIAMAVTATGISSSNHTITTTANTSHLWIDIDGDVKDTVVLGGVSVPNTSSNWTFLQNNVMPYLERQRIWVGGVLRQDIAWEYSDTFTDASGNNNDATPTFRSTSSDADVSAELVSFSPITEAKAPAYSVNITTTGWITATDTQSGNFTTTTNATYPGSDVIAAVTTAGNVPIQLLELILAGVFILSLSLFISWIMRTNREGNLIFKIAIIVAGLGIMIAVGIIDNWILYLFLMISIALAMAASQRVFTGTGNTGNNMVGFLAMAFVGMTTINRILEGRFLQSTDVDIVREVLAFQPFEVFGLFVIPVPNTNFLIHGLPALMRWDYSFFGGNAQIFQYLLYSITAVVSFMLLVLVFGAVYQMFSRGR